MDDCMHPLSQLACKYYDKNIPLFNDDYFVITEIFDCLPIFQIWNLFLIHLIYFIKAERYDTNNN